jgi:hypothetical protein
MVGRAQGVNVNEVGLRIWDMRCGIWDLKKA